MAHCEVCWGQILGLVLVVSVSLRTIFRPCLLNASLLFVPYILFLPIIIHMSLFVYRMYFFYAYKCPRLWDEGLNLLVPNMIVHLSPVINYWTVD